MKSQNANRVIFLFLTMVLVFINGSSFSKSYDCPINGDCHRTDWYELLGVDPTQKRLDRCFNVFQDQIDRDVYQSSFYRELKDKYPNFTQGSSGHRFFFHWGFAANPCNSRKVTEQIVKMKLDSNEKNDFCNILIKEQGRRNRIMIDAVRTATSLSRTKSSDLATLIYNVHILGDYEDTITDPLADLGLINSDNQRAIRNMQFDPLESKILFQNLDTCIKNKDSKLGARCMLGCLKKYFPPLLYKKYGSFLENNGIVIQEQKREVAKNDSSLNIKSIKKLFGF